MSYADKARKIIAEMKDKDGYERNEKNEISSLPYLDLDGGLVIPFGSDPRFHYWAGGQSIKQTEEEVRGWLH